MRVAVAKTDTTEPASIAEAANEPLQLGSATRPERAAKGSKSQVAAAEPAAPAETADPTAATKSIGWAVQLGAPRSEAEANSEMTSTQRQICVGPQRVVDWRAQGGDKG